ncbi:MAG TPA: Fe-S cluster assembly protein SufB [Acidimicrobiales bacterium]|nr:Fe-S cluster assembly protein SufB [Acidimicrobiales bacterium]
MATTDLDLGRYKLGWSDAEDYVFKPKRGLNRAIVEEMSWMKGEPEWMRKYRLRALDIFERKPMPNWGGDMSEIFFDDIYYYIKPTEKQVSSWDQLPDSVKETYEKLGIPEAERKYLAGVTAQYECLRGSTRVWTDKGMRAIKELNAGDVVFSLDEASREIVTGTVVAGGCSGEKEIYEISARGRTIGASGNHPFLVLRDEREEGRQRRRYKARWIAAEELREGDLVAVPTDLPDYGASAELMLPTHVKGAAFPLESTVDLCWWAGVYLGDGFIHHRGDYSSVEIAIDRTDTTLVDEIIRVTRELFGIELVVDPPGFRLSGRGTAALAEFVELNGLGGKAHTKRVPDWMFGVPTDQRLAFLAGLTNLASVSADDVAELAVLTLPRCDADVPDGEMFGYVRIGKIERVGAEPVFDIEVAGHHNFVAEGFVVHNSEVVYHRNRDDLAEQGVLFTDMDTALREHPEIVKKYFGKIIPATDNKFAALNSAVWSGGSFIYIPPGVKVEMPLQAYFRINAENMGQFERTLIIADEGSQVHYIEGCSAPVYTSDSLHSAVVEIMVHPSARVTYTTIQNWSNNVFNLVTKRARCQAEAHMEWIDGNIGSRLTMKYPAVYLMGPKASGEVLSVAYAGAGQHQDAGAKMVHAAPETSSTIISKSIAKDGGRTSYRGLVRVEEGAEHINSFTRCDALLLDDISRSDTYPYIERNAGTLDARIGHEATVSKVGDEQLFYLMSRGLSEQQAMSMIVNGFIEPVTRTLPMEYAVEWSRLIELQMEGSVG